MTTVYIHRDAAAPAFVAALEAAGAEVIVTDVDPAELAGIEIDEDDGEEPCNHSGWDRELGGASDGSTVYSDADPGL